jgi:hypothetical protein
LKIVVYNHSRLSYKGSIIKQRAARLRTWRTTMIKLTFPTSTFDTGSHFAFETETKRFGEIKRERHEGYLFRDDTDGQIYVVKCASCLKSSYTDADRALTQRIYHGAGVLRTGDQVEVDGEVFTVKILGVYSDAGRLIPT